MSEETKEMEQQQTTINPDIDYIEAIKKLKSTTVPLEEYEKLQARNKQMLDSFTVGKNESAEKPKEEPKISSEKARENLFGVEDLTNLEYVKRALELRDAVIREGGDDPFVANNVKVHATQYDYEAAEKVATVMKECIEYAQGDSEVFTNELMRRTADAAPMGYGR